MPEIDAQLVERTRKVHDLARELGFALVGIAPPEATAHAEYLDQWLAEGKHGEMAYLATHVDVRADPTNLLPGAKAVICVADWYGGDAALDAPNDSTPVGRVARYAWGDDYHLVMKDRLHALADALRDAFPGYEYRTCVDTAPILEREHAARAGLGWVGKHTLLIHPRYGSWFLLGEIVTTLPLITTEQPPPPTPPPAPPEHVDIAHVDPLNAHAIITDHCGTCTRCIDACPTHCIEPYQLDASRCISYLTIEHRGPIDPSLHAAMGDWIAGCDVCQDVCPHNGAERRQETGDRGQGAGETEATKAGHFNASDAPIPMHPRYAPRSHAPAIALLDILNWSADDRREMFRSSALKRIKLDMLKRNALIAAGNHLAANDDEALRQRIVAIADDAGESDLVRLTARQVLGRLLAQ